jgi:MerR family transcriptional regulator, Zn(II)-responsive regulator of zntA
MNVTQLARKTTVSADAVRYYARIGLLRPGRNPDNGYRKFDVVDIQRLRFIRQAKTLGFTLDEIREMLDEARKGRSPCPRVREILQHRVRENAEKLRELMRLQRRMEKALARWQALPDGVPDGHSVCHLIESEG